MKRRDMLKNIFYTSIIPTMSEIEKRKKKESKPEKPDKRNIFCREYITDFNATQAAIRAGYSEATAKQAGSRLLSFVDIQNRIKKLLDKRKEKIEVNQQQIINELRKIGFASLDDIEMDGGKIDIKKTDMSLIKSVYTSYNALTKREQSKVELHPKMKALELLMRHLNMLNDFDPNSSNNGNVHIYNIPYNNRDPIEPLDNIKKAVKAPQNRLQDAPVATESTKKPKKDA